MKSKLLLLLTLLVSTFSWGQTIIFSENFGTPIANPTTIINYNNGTVPATFQNIIALSFDNGGAINPADIRNTTVSSGYTGASGGGNTWFTTTNGTYGFSIESINSAGYTSLTLDYGYHKASNTNLATFSVEFWNGSAWTVIANTAANLFNEAANSPIGWYQAKQLLLPVSAQINDLKIRFVKTGTREIRIDDIVLRGTTSLSCIAGNLTLQPSNQSIIEDGNATFTVAASNISSYQWQESLDGIAYNNIGDNGVYSGTTTSTLTLTGVPVSMTGYKYRCQLIPASPCVAIKSKIATLTVNAPNCLTEGFNSGATQPSGWTFVGINNTYTGGGNFGVASPSLQMDNSGESITTPIVANIQQLSFWMKGQGTASSSSSLLVQGYNSNTASWVTIENITTIPSNAIYLKVYNSNTTPILPQNIIQIRFTYTKATGNMALDDVVFNCSECPNSSSWNGSWSNGVPDISTTAIVKENYNTSTWGSFEACKVVVNNGKTLEIDDSDYVKIQNNLIVNGNLIVNNNGSIVQINNTINKGNIVYKRTATGLNGYDYIYWSSPVFSTSTSGQLLDNIYSLPTQGSKYKWNTTGINANLTRGRWDFANGNYMLPAKGYIVRASSSSASTNNTINANFIGIPNNGDITIKGKRGSIYPTLDDNWSLIGNPYPSAISLWKFLHQNSILSNDFLGNIYLWGHLDAPGSYANPFYQSFIYNYNSGNYVALNFSGGSIPPPPGTDYTIKANQAFFIQRTEGLEDTIGADIMFTNYMRIDGNNLPYNNSGFFRTNNNENVDYLNLERNRIWLDIVNNNSLLSTTALIGYIEGATMAVDNLFDAKTAELSFGLYSIIDNDKFIIQGRSLPFNDNDLVVIGINLTSAGNHTIAIRQVDGIFEGNQNIYLEDKQLNIIHDLKQSPYHFTAPTGVNNTRFVLRYTTNALGNADFDYDNQVIVFSKNNTVTINSSIQNIDEVQVYDVLGRQLYQNTAVENQEHSFAKDIAQQTIIVKVKLQNGIWVTKKVLVK